MLDGIAVITDNVNMTTDTESSQWYESKAWPTLIATNDYYLSAYEVLHRMPFGLAMSGRTSQLTETNAYRYGFNGKELDNWNQADQEPPSGGGPPGPPPAPDDAVAKPGSGTVYDYGFRIYNPRIAKFLSVDPLTKSYPMLTPYQFASNTPIQAIDLDGLEARITVNSQYNSKRISKLFHPNEKYISSEVGKQAALLIAWYSVDAVYENDDHLKMYPNIEFPKTGKAAEVTYDGSFVGVQIWGKDENDNEVYLGSINNMEKEETSFFDFFDIGVGEYKERNAGFFDNLIARNVDQNALKELNKAFGNGFDLRNSIFGDFLNRKGIMIGGGLRNLDSYEGEMSEFQYLDTIIGGNDSMKYGSYKKYGNIYYSPTQGPKAKEEDFEKYDIVDIKE